MSDGVEVEVLVKAADHVRQSMVNYRAIHEWQRKRIAELEAELESYRQDQTCPDCGLKYWPHTCIV